MLTGGDGARLFQKSDFGVGHVDGAGTIALDAATFAGPAAKHGWRGRIEDWAHEVDLVPDLGRDIGTVHWWRGLLTCLTLCGTMLYVAPGMEPVPGRAPAALTTGQFDQLRSQMVMPLALGADSGRHMGPTDAVARLTETPERPSIDLDAVVGNGDSFGRMLQRAGVSANDAGEALALIGGAVDPGSIAAGTRVKITLGRRPTRSVPRPLDALSVRARLDLALEIARIDGALTLKQIPIAVDDTPLRIRGTVGGSLYRSARAAGADPRTIQTYLKVIAQQVSLDGDVGAGDRFDMVVAHRRAATGETETGELLFAGLDRARGKSINMLRWTLDGRDHWFEASGVGEKRAGLARPVAGNMTSRFGMRSHPILGYTRMHKGVDFGAPYGAPIYAVSAGRVVFAGRNGGHGKYVRLDHGGGIGTGYAHMSSIVAQPGERVRQGQVIGYVGSTGLSTGPHLHYEVYRRGVAVNPLTVKFMQAPRLSGARLAAFRAKLAQLKNLPVGDPSPAVAEAAGEQVIPAGVGRVILAR